MNQVERQNILDLPADVGLAVMRDRVQRAADADPVADLLVAVGLTDDDHLDIPAILQMAQWDPGDGDGPRQMTEAEAEAVVEFADWVITGRKVWPTDSVGAGLKLADWHHDWAALPTPDEWGHEDEEDAVQTAVTDYIVKSWRAAQTEE
jgi:hypothetical protein